MTLAKVEGLGVEHAVALGRLGERSDNLVKEVSDLNPRYALTEKDIIKLKLASDRGRTLRLALFTALWIASLSLIVSIIVAVHFRSKP